VTEPTNSPTYPVPSQLPRLFSRPDRLHDPLYVVTTIFNSPRYRTRWKLYEDFALRVERAGAILYTVEVAFGERDWAVTTPDNPCHLQLRTSNELWLKENAINLGVSRLPADWKYVAWIDADVTFARNDWADETRHLLQHYPIIQMWSEAQDLTPSHTTLGSHLSMAWCEQEGMDRMDRVPQYPYSGRGGPSYWHPGYAWACTRWAWNAFGGLLDFCLLGAADHHMAWSFLGEWEQAINRSLHPRYQEFLMEWGRRADAAIKRNIGCMPGLILHDWHGAKFNRGYKTRNNILIEESYDPSSDIYRDWQGLWQLADRSPVLRDRIRTYFRERDEDSTHIPEGA
jgi:hypothetical protein